MIDANTCAPEPFLGWDWTELVTPLGFPGSIEDDGEETIIEAIRRTLSMVHDGGEMADQIEGLCREYLDKLVERDAHTCVPLFDGLSRIEDRDSFIKYFSLLLPHLWS